MPIFRASTVSAVPKVCYWPTLSRRSDRLVLAELCRSAPARRSTVTGTGGQFNRNTHARKFVDDINEKFALEQVKYDMVDIMPWSARSSRWERVVTLLWPLWSSASGFCTCLHGNQGDAFSLAFCH